MPFNFNYTTIINLLLSSVALNQGARIIHPHENGVVVLFEHYLK